MRWHVGIHPVADPGFTPDRSQRLQGPLKLKKVSETERSILEKSANFLPLNGLLRPKTGNITLQKVPVGTEMGPLEPKKEPFCRPKDPVVSNKTTLCQKI